MGISPVVRAKAFGFIGTLLKCLVRAASMRWSPILLLIYHRQENTRKPQIKGAPTTKERI